MMIQIHQKSIPTAQLQHRLVQGESNIEKVVFFVPNVPNIDFSVLIFTIKLLAEDEGKIVIGELDMDPTENGILLSWDVSKKYTRYGGGTRLQIDGVDATGNIVYRALSEKFCMRKELTGEDAVQDPEPDPEAGYVPPIESGDNGKYLRAMNGEAIWDEIDHPKEIFWVELDTSAMKCSHSPTEILEAVNKGLFIIGRSGTTNLRFYCTNVGATFALFESYASEDKEVYGETCPGIYVLRYEVNPAKKMSFKYSFVLSHKKLPNPFPLEFEGAVTGSYDGSAPMKIKIPTGGSGGGEKEIFWVDFDQTSRTASHSASEILEALKSGLLVLGRQGADISFVTGTTTSIVLFGQLFYSERNAGTAEAAPTIYYDQIVVKEDKSFYRNVFSVSQFDTLPNPFPLKFSGAVSGSYDGSSEFNLNIPDIPTIPDKLPNPHTLTFSGAVEGTYDGSEPMTVEIPEGGAGGIVFEDSYVSNANDWVTNGYTKTNTSTTNLPSVITGSSKWGVLFYIAENGTTGTQMLYPIDGTYKGTIWTRACVKQNFNEWKQLMTSDQLPTNLPNPNAITFTGSSVGTYDGSAPLTINIPAGLSGDGSLASGSGYTLISELTLEEDVQEIMFDTDSNGNPFAFEELLLLMSVTPTANDDGTASTDGHIYIIPNKYWAVNSYIGRDKLNSGWSHDFQATMFSKNGWFWGNEAYKSSGYTTTFPKLKREEAPLHSLQITMQNRKIAAGSQFILFGR